jgi:hypothetical protein
VPIPRDGIRGFPCFLLAALVTIASAMVGMGLFTAGAPEAEEGILRYISIGVLILLALFLWRYTRSAKGLLPVLILTGVAVGYFTGSPLLTAALAALLFAVGEGSFLLATLSRKQLCWFPIIPILAYAAALAMTRDPFVAAAALIPFPAMIVLGLGTRSSAAKEEGMTRVGVVCATSLALGVTLLAVIALVIFHQLRTLSLDVLAAEVEALREALINDITSAEIPEGMDPEMVAELEKLLTYSGAQNLVNSVFNLLPALFVVAVNLISAVAQMIQHATLCVFGYDECLTERVRIFRMSLISCLVFLVAYFISFAEGQEASTLTGTVAQNIYMILLPGLALAGLIRLTSALTRKGPRGMGCLFYLILILPCLFIFAPFVLAAAEVIGHIFSAVTSAIKPRDDEPPFGQD